MFKIRHIYFYFFNLFLFCFCFCCCCFFCLHTKITYVYFNKSIMQHIWKLDDILKSRCHYFSVFSMPFFAVNDCLDATRHAGYHRFEVLLGDFSDCLPQVHGCLFATLPFITVQMFSIALKSGSFTGHSCTEVLFVFFRNSGATFNG